MFENFISEFSVIFSIFLELNVTFFMFVEIITRALYNLFEFIVYQSISKIFLSILEAWGCFCDLKNLSDVCWICFFLTKMDGTTLKTPFKLSREVIKKRF